MVAGSIEALNPYVRSSPSVAHENIGRW